jgi:flagellar FliL protein
MAKPTAADVDTSEAPAAGGGRRKVLLLAPVLLLLVAGWFFVLGPGAGSEAAEEPAEPELGEVVPLDPITMNLADGRLLKVGLALQLPAEPASDHEVNGSVALDEAISFLGGHTYAQLAPPAARQEAKAELSHRVAERYHDEVLEVYFTEFVMQ